MFYTLKSSYSQKNGRTNERTDTTSISGDADTEYKHLMESDIYPKTYNNSPGHN